MIVSRMMAVLPVWRSPMISSRWPRPIGNHRVDGLDAGLQRLAHRLAVDDAGRDALDRDALVGDDRALAVERHAQRIDHAADQRVAHRRGHDRARALDRVAFLNRRVFAQQHRADLVFFQVERDAENVVRELQHLAGHHFFQAVDARDAVAHGDDRADLVHGHRLVVVGDLLAQNLCNFVRFNGCHACFAPIRDSSARAAVRAACAPNRRKSSNRCAPPRRQSARDRGGTAPPRAGR